MTPQCFVTARDYRQYWPEGSDDAPHPGGWDGVERRVAVHDRRQGAHDRRWEAMRGRRFRLSDRRRGSA